MTLHTHMHTNTHTHSLGLMDHASGLDDQCQKREREREKKECRALSFGRNTGFGTCKLNVGDPSINYRSQPAREYPNIH